MKTSMLQSLIASLSIAITLSVLPAQNLVINNKSAVRSPQVGDSTVGGQLNVGVDARSTTATFPGITFSPTQLSVNAWCSAEATLLGRRAEATSLVANATVGAEIAGEPKAEARRKALSLFPRFGLGGFEKSWPVQLSGGMRQRLALLRTFLVPHGVPLLDEPFGSLDALTRRSLQTWLQEVLGSDGARSEGVGPGSGLADRTVLVVTHDVEEAILLADRVVVLSARPGRVVADVAVPLPRPRRATLVTDPEVVALRATLLDALGA